MPEETIDIPVPREMAENFQRRGGVYIRRAEMAFLAESARASLDEVEELEWEELMEAHEAEAEAELEEAPEDPRNAAGGPEAYDVAGDR